MLKKNIYGDVVWLIDGMIKILLREIFYKSIWSIHKFKYVVFVGENNQGIDLIRWIIENWAKNCVYFVAS